MSISTDGLFKAWDDMLSKGPNIRQTNRGFILLILTMISKEAKGVLDEYLEAEKLDLEKLKVGKPNPKNLLFIIGQRVEKQLHRSGLDKEMIDLVIEHIDPLFDIKVLSETGTDYITMLYRITSQVIKDTRHLTNNDYADLFYSIVSILGHEPMLTKDNQHLIKSISKLKESDKLYVPYIGNGELYTYFMAELKVKEVFGFSKDPTYVTLVSVASVLAGHDINNFKVKSKRYSFISEKQSFDRVFLDLRKLPTEVDFKKELKYSLKTIDKNQQSRIYILAETDSLKDYKNYIRKECVVNNLGTVETVIDFPNSKGNRYSLITINPNRLYSTNPSFKTDFFYFEKPYSPSINEVQIINIIEKGEEELIDFKWESFLISSDDFIWPSEQTFSTQTSSRNPYGLTDRDFLEPLYRGVVYDYLKKPLIECAE